MSEIVPGTVVRLKSGGPDLTVTSMDETHARVCWFMEGEVKVTKIPLLALDLASAGPLRGRRKQQI